MTGISEAMDALIEQVKADDNMGKVEVITVTITAKVGDKEYSSQAVFEYSEDPGVEA